MTDTISYIGDSIYAVWNGYDMSVCLDDVRYPPETQWIHFGKNELNNLVDFYNRVLLEERNQNGSN